MIKKIKEIYDFLEVKKGELETYENGIICVYTDRDYREVQCISVDDVENITGQQVSVLNRDCKDYPFEAHVRKDGIYFFCLLDKAEYEEYKNSRAENTTTEKSI